MTDVNGLVDEPPQQQIDSTIVHRARTVMETLILNCLNDPMEPAPLRAAADVQGMLLDDVAAAQHRLEATA